MPHKATQTQSNIVLTRLNSFNSDISDFPIPSFTLDSGFSKRFINTRFRIGAFSDLSEIACVSENLSDSKSFTCIEEISDYEFPPMKRRKFI